MNSPVLFLVHAGQRGYVLVTALIFLSVLTLIGVVTMRSSTLEQRMSANSAFRTQALESSEAGRGAISEVLDYHIFYRGWPSDLSAPSGSLASGTFSVPAGLTVRDIETNGDTSCGTSETADGVADALYLSKVSCGFATDAEDYSTVDAWYSVDVNSDGTADLAANIFVFRTDATQSPGAATAMVSGYEGTGKSAAAGGGLLYFDVRAQSSGGGAGATVLTGADYRHVIRN